MKKIPLGRSEKFALVDEDDFIYLSYHKWSLSSTGYAHNAKLGYMHRCIMKTDKEVDHINRDSLDNRRCNLREASRSQNLANRSKSSKKKTSIYKGVTRSDNVWQAQIRCGGKYMYLGRFKTEVEAAKVYNEKAKEFHGEFAKLNVIEGE